LPNKTTGSSQHNQIKEKIPHQNMDEK
jgi:hypothetical protein